MKKKIPIIIGGLLAIALTFAYAHISKTHCIYDTEIDTSDYLSTAAMLNEEISQTFVSEEDTLDGMSVKVRLTGETSGIETVYKLVNMESGEVVAEGTAEGDVFEDSKFYEFKFNTIENCKGKEYQFIIQNQGETSGNSINFCYETNIEKNTKMEIDSNEQTGTLILKTVTDRFDIETFCVLLIFIIYIVFFLKFIYKLFK